MSLIAFLSIFSLINILPLAATIIWQKCRRASWTTLLFALAAFAINFAAHIPLEQWLPKIFSLLDAYPPVANKVWVVWFLYALVYGVFRKGVRWLILPRSTGERSARPFKFRRSGRRPNPFTYRNNADRAHLCVVGSGDSHNHIPWHRPDNFQCWHSTDPNGHCAKRSLWIFLSTVLLFAVYVLSPSIVSLNFNEPAVVDHHINVNILTIIVTVSFFVALLPFPLHHLHKPRPNQTKNTKFPDTHRL